MCVGGRKKRERERGGTRERESLLRALRRTTRRRRWTRGGREVEPWALINETYAAAADTETHCKYGVPKKNYCPRDEIYTCPNYTHVEASDPFVRSFRRTIRLEARLLFCVSASFASIASGARIAARRYSCIYMGQQMPDGRW